MAWSEQAAKYLRGSSTCPRCEKGPVGAEHCPFCGALLTGPVADELRAVSAQAAGLLDARQQIIGRLPTKAALAPPPTASTARPATVAAAGAAAATTLAPPAGPPIAGPTPYPAAPARSSQVSLQSVLAIMGAVLVAVAVIVFRFATPDVDIAVRRGVTGVATLFFLGFAWLLARGRFTFSAEAVGAVAMVFVALDVWAISELASDDPGRWMSAAIATLVASVLMIAIAALVRLRTWLWLGLAGLVLVPVFLGAAVEGRWSAVTGNLGAVAVALAGYEVARRLSARFASPLYADRVMLTLLAAFFGVVALLGLPFVGEPTFAGWILGTALVLVVLALLAVAATRTLAPAAWSATVGVLATAAAAILPFALDLDEESWWLALIPSAAAVALAALSLAPWPRFVRRIAVRAGAVVVALVAAVPALTVASAQLLSPLVPRFLLPGGQPGDLWTEPMAREVALFPETPSIAAVLGIAAAAVGTAALALSIRREGRSWRPWVAVTSWLVAGTLTTVVGWSALSKPGQVVLGVLIALGLALALLLIPRVRAAAPLFRVPFLVAAHVILGYLVVLSWGDDRIVVAAGAAVVVVLGVLSLLLPAMLRPLFVVVGYGYALLLLARGLDLLGLDTIAVISYTATAASLFALAVTLVRRVRAPRWYAVLGVTAVPFAIGIATVILERTWETALANAAVFALALTLTLTRRPGLTPVVRAGAAALLLPALAVIAVNVVPRIVETGVVPAWVGGGGAPVTLPVIATLVALVLPTTPLVAGLLGRGDVPAADTAAVRLWIEISAFVTGGIAALLSLVLETPDLGTSLVVFVILGIGAAGASVFARRRYGWWIAAGCWTAALWCVWGLAGIRDIEPYVYPPALAAVVIGVVLLLRGRRGAALVAPGLAIAIVTSLLVLAASGSGPLAVLPWRALALIAAALAFVVFGSLIDRAGVESRLAALRVPLLVVAIGAAAAGPIQAVRYAWELDSLGLGHPDHVVWPVLVFSVAGAVLAASAARALRPTHRWLQTPALAFLVVGPIAAVAPGVAPMWTLWVLTLVLLGIMLVTVLAALRGPTILPPTWLVFAAAWCTAVAGWSVRDLNVEWFSLPLGLALTAAGVLVLARGRGAGGGTLSSWPVGFVRSWAVLAPGIVVTILPSVLATGTNPATWRAILVIALALVALLVGAMFRYAAPFVVSLVAFGVEIIVILVQLAAGRDIDPVVFWISALTAGGILIVVGIWFERRSRAGAEGARMRDLR